MLKAQELLMKHKLSLREVEDYKVINSAIKEKESGITFKKAKWKASLGSLIGDNFGCYCFFRTYYSHNIVFLGREEDVTICNIVLEYAIDCINNSVKKLAYQNIKKGLSTKGLENDYALGFIAGLWERFDEQKEKNKEWGLVLVKDSEVTDVYENIDFVRTVNGDTSYKGHAEAYWMGKDEGYKFNISDKITEGDNQENLLITNKNGGEKHEV